MTMLKTRVIPTKPLFWLLLFAVLLTGCNERVEVPTETPQTDISPSPTLPISTPIPEEPTAIPIPAAALVNEERISLVWFEREVERFIFAQQTLGIEVSMDAARQRVLNDLIDQVLLAQGAREAGVQFNDADVQARIDQLAAEVNLDAWMAEWGYTPEELFDALQLQMLAANQRDRVAATIPEAVEQVELQQVFRFTEVGANQALSDLNAGETFDVVAFASRPDTRGYIGWVPRGYLLIQAIEEAVFDLPVGSYTEIIQSEVGFHIVLVLDREERPLTADARLVLERQALYDWLEERRSTSVIEVLID